MEIHMHIVPKMANNDVNLEVDLADDARIKKSICALLNSNGGKLTLTASNDTDLANADKNIHRCEQNFRNNVIGVYNVHKYIEVLKRVDNRITLVVSGLPTLCTLNTNLYLPTDRQVVLLPATEQDALRKILFESRIVEISEHEVPEQFCYEHKTKFGESKTVQLKHIEAKKKGRKDFVSRAIDNKLKECISAFANGSGGVIYYGIKDDRTVVGELLAGGEKDRQEITEKLEKEVRKMIWPEESGKIECGKQWNIEFVPVTNCSDKRFVIVVSVSPCCNGVFTKEPESYYIEKKDDVKVEKMSFETWKRNMYLKVPEPKEMNRTTWSSKRSEKNYMSTTEELEKFRQCADWETIEAAFTEISNTTDPNTTDPNTTDPNTELIFLFQMVAVQYRQGMFKIAEDHLTQFRNMVRKTKDPSVFDVEERYSSSAIERSRGDYQKAWGIIEEGLPKADFAPAGFIPASFYAHGASVLSKLIQDKSFIDENKDDKDFKGKVRQHVKNAKRLCDMALQHLMYFKDNYKIAKEELEQRLNITLALLCLKSANEDLASNSDLRTVDDKIKEAEKSFKNLEQEGTSAFKFNYCRLLLAKSQLHSELAKRCLKKADIIRFEKSKALKRDSNGRDKKQPKDNEDENVEEKQAPEKKIARKSCESA